MPKRALVERRPWLLGSLIAAFAYYWMADDQIGGVYLIGFKGAALGLLAIYAVLRHPGSDARLLAGVMVIAAAANIALDLYPATAVILFFVSHIAALALFLRNRRGQPTTSQKRAATALLLLVPLISLILTQGRADSSTITIYALSLGAMAGAAWISRFPRYRVGTGGVAICLAQLLLIAALRDPRAGIAANWFLWPLYYGGQFLICTGVIQTLRGEHPAA